MTRGVYPVARLATALAGCLALLPSGCCGGGATARIAETRRLMGVPWTITVHAADAAAGRAAVAAAFAEVERLERILSDYDPASELARLSAAAPTDAPVPVGPEVWDVLARAEEFRAATDGAFSIAVGPLCDLWRRARRSGRLPRPDALAAARAAADPAGLVLDAAARSVRLDRAGMRLDPGGIGMGYAADRALDVLARHGITAALIDASGDVVVSGPPPGAAAWRIALDPLARGATGASVLELVHAAVTTSGDAFQGVEIDGTRYSHVVDPRTGLGVTGPAAATVIAPDATTADALATAASVLGPEDGPATLTRFPNCAARWVWAEADGPRERTTPGWRAAGRNPP